MNVPDRLRCFWSLPPGHAWEVIDYFDGVAGRWAAFSRCVRCDRTRGLAVGGAVHGAVFATQPAGHGHVVSGHQAVGASVAPPRPHRSTAGRKGVGGDRARTRPAPLRPARPRVVRDPSRPHRLRRAHHRHRRTTHRLAEPPSSGRPVDEPEQPELGRGRRAAASSSTSSASHSGASSSAFDHGCRQRQPRPRRPRRAAAAGGGDGHRCDLRARQGRQGREPGRRVRAARGGGDARLLGRDGRLRRRGAAAPKSG